MNPTEQNIRAWTRRFNTAVADMAAAVTAADVVYGVSSRRAAIAIAIHSAFSCGREVALFAASFVYEAAYHGDSISEEMVESGLKALGKTDEVTSSAIATAATAAVAMRAEERSAPQSGKVMSGHDLARYVIANRTSGK